MSSSALSPSSSSLFFFSPPGGGSKKKRFPRRPTFLVAAVLLVLSVITATPGGAAAESDEPECPQVDLSDIGVISEPCADATKACDLVDGCMGAIIGFIESKVDLTQFSEMPSQDYITGEAVLFFTVQTKYIHSQS